jgi:hypothetical protein
MRSSVLFGSGVLVLCLFVGCGGSSAEDALFKDQIKFYNDAAAKFEGVTDKASYEKVKSEAEASAKKALELAGKILETGMKSPEKLKSASEKYAGELKTAQERYMKAMTAAAMKAAQ